MNNNELKRTLSDPLMYSTGNTLNTSDSLESIDYPMSPRYSQYQTFEIKKSPQNNKWGIKTYIYLYVLLLWCFIYIILYQFYKWIRNTVLLIGIIIQVIMLFYLINKKIKNNL